MGEMAVFSISELIGDKPKETVDKKEVDLEEALDIVGLGWYNIRYCMLYSGFLFAAMLETVGYTYTLQAGRCDLGVTDKQRGLITSLLHIAIVISSHFWGYMADTRGRKPVLLVASFSVGILGAVAFLMPDIVSFAVLKFIASIFMTCPGGISYALIGEITPKKYRDFALYMVTTVQIFGTAAIALLAWLILPLDFSVDIGFYYFRPWRLLGMIYSLSFVVCALCLLPGLESPKFLVAKGRFDEALVVLQKMYAGNKWKRPEDFPVLAIRRPPSVDGSTEDKVTLVESLKKQTLPLFRTPYLKWMMLNSFLLLGVICTINGLFLWVPHVLNSVLISGSASEGSTACQIIASRFNSSSVIKECDDSIATSTFQINSIANTSVAVVSMLVAFIVQFIGKKAVLILVFALMGAACIFINYATQTAVFAFLACSILVTTICLGPINAYSVAIFPTELRGMAVGLSIMFARIGCVISNNISGILINTACEVTFFSFGGLLLLCSLLSFLLPKDSN